MLSNTEHTSTSLSISYWRKSRSCRFQTNTFFFQLMLCSSLCSFGCKDELFFLRSISLSINKNKNRMNNYEMVFTLSFSACSLRWMRKSFLENRVNKKIVWKYWTEKCLEKLYNACVHFLRCSSLPFVTFFLQLQLNKLLEQNEIIYLAFCFSRIFFLLCQTRWNRMAKDSEFSPARWKEPPSVEIRSS